MYRITCALVLISLCAGCGRLELRSLSKETQKAATADEWHSWAARVIEQAGTNQMDIPRSEWPEFVKKMTNGPRPWRVLVNPAAGTSPGLVNVFALAGFGGVGMTIGPQSYVQGSDDRRISKQIYPGIYGWVY